MSGFLPFLIDKSNLIHSFDMFVLIWFTDVDFFCLLCWRSARFSVVRWFNLFLVLLWCQFISLFVVMFWKDFFFYLFFFFCIIYIFVIFVIFIIIIIIIFFFFSFLRSELDVKMVQSISSFCGKRKGSVLLGCWWKKIHWFLFRVKF
jgi:hypothetical protein